MQLLPYKQPHEKFIHTIDFINLVGTAPITYANATVTLLVGTVDDTGIIVLAALTSDGAVNLTIRNGTDKQDYAIRLLVSDSNESVFSEDLVLRVREVLN